ncbi:hypothetical protein [Lentilitoribacter sp. Alg239-R112]|uniref:hypothetical protein n=1 Tax=Lentilitoribacter sp. Alg239-R112 TaxID=2305987 RepID=UPI0013A69205|nr:hypothetical protein [Lentilitoribacter sp. Alg239-R112]
MITEKETQFARHALGLTRGKIAYRNGFHAGGKDIDTGRSLEAKGMAVSFPPSELFPDVIFCITTKGFEAIKKRGEKLDREELERIKRLDQKALAGASR